MESYIIVSVYFSVCALFFMFLLYGHFKRYSATKAQKKEPSRLQQTTKVKVPIKKEKIAPVHKCRICNPALAFGIPLPPNYEDLV